MAKKPPAFTETEQGRDFADEPSTAPARPSIAPFDADTPADKIAERNEALVGFNSEFCRDLPQDPRSGQHAKDGRYDAVEGDRFAGKLFPVPDGAYRVAGSDWVHAFEGGAFVHAFRATKENGFGGPDVIAVSLS